MDNDKTFAYDLVKTLITFNKRLFIITLFLAVAFVGTNLAWLYVFQCYDYTSTTTTTEVIQESKGGTVNYTQKGDINNGEADGENDNNGEGTN